MDVAPNVTVTDTGERVGAPSGGQVLLVQTVMTSGLGAVKLIEDLEEAFHAVLALLPTNISTDHVSGAPAAQRCSCPVRAVGGYAGTIYGQG